MREQGKNILIGVFVLAAIVLLVFLVLFLHPSPGNEDQKLHVRFSNIDKIQIGTRVTFGGQPIGKVEEIIDHFRCDSLDARMVSGPLYFFELVLAIDSTVCVYTTDEVMIKTYGFFGDRNIAIIPKHPPAGVTPKKVTPEMVIYAKAGDQMEEVFNNITDLSASAKTALDKVSDLIDANTDDINGAIRAFKTTMAEVGVTFADLNEAELIATLHSAFGAFEQVMDNVHTHLVELENEGFWGDVTTIGHNVADASKNVSNVTHELANGDSTIGRLLTEDDLYLEAQTLLTKADTMFNDINHYGILFHQNRRWQRERTARANMLAAISTPQGFRNYVNTEADAISCSIARLNILLEESKCSKAACNPCFVDEFAELLRRVKSLEERLQLYNQTICECDCSCECR